MFESISQTVSSNIAIVLSLIASALLIAAYYSSMRFRFWIRDFWVSLPLIGLITRLSKDRTHGSNGWLRAEESLCAEYKPFITMMRKNEFNKRIEYLRKSADLGRTPTPFLIWVLLVVLVIAEGLGFSYLLGTWMAMEGSANTHTILMIAIVLVLCVILVAITHFAGHQYYRTSLLRSCFARFKDTHGKEYSVDIVSLAKDQSIDDNAPDFKQIVNRVAKNSHDKGSYAAGIIAIITIAVIATASTYMRVKNLEAKMDRESAVLIQQANPSNPFAGPSEVIAVQQQADAKGLNDSKKSEGEEGIAAFVMLGFIFVITQIVAAMEGVREHPQFVEPARVQPIFHKPWAGQCRLQSQAQLHPATLFPERRKILSHCRNTGYVKPKSQSQPANAELSSDRRPRALALGQPNRHRHRLRKIRPQGLTQACIQTREYLCQSELLDALPPDPNVAPAKPYPPNNQDASQNPG